MVGNTRQHNSQARKPAALVQKDESAHGRHHGPVAGTLEQGLETGAGVGVFGAARRRRSVGQGAVDQDGALSVDGGNVDERLVQGGVVAIANQLVQVARLAVLVAAADHIRIAAAGDGLGLVDVGGLVEEAVWLRVRVEVGAVVPGARPESQGEGCAGEEAGGDRGDARR